MENRFLFRGKRVDYGEWIEGNLKLDSDNAHVFIAEKQPALADTRGYEVIPETVGQCTGLTDKNGTLIFEGDVVSRSGEKYEIVWGADGNAQGYIVQGFGCKHIAEYSMGIMTLRTKQNESLEIIGNRFDNGELLTGEVEA